MTLELIFGTHTNWQVAVVCEANKPVAAFYDNVTKPNLTGAVATGRITELHGNRGYVELPDGEEGFVEGKHLPPAGAHILVRIATYVLPPKAWPLKLVEGNPASNVQWHDAATSVIDHATALYNVPQSAMRQDDDTVADFLRQHMGREDLRDGASIVVEQTSALTTIDLNTGRLHGVANWIATFAPAIAEALRHYNIGGAVVVDAEFLGHQARQGLADKLEGLLNNDPLHPKLIGTTRMGLVEITRMRTGPSRLAVEM